MLAWSTLFSDPFTYLGRYSVVGGPLCGLDYRDSTQISEGQTFTRGNAVA